MSKAAERSLIRSRLAEEKNRNLHPAHLALTLSAGEYRVGGGELKVSRQVGLPRNPRARRPKPKMASLYF